MHLYKVRVEWLLKGKGEKYHPEHYTVVAPSAAVASAAALKRCRDGWELHDARVEEVVRCDKIDIVCSR